jgi:FG-GAP-like repeat
MVRQNGLCLSYNGHSLLAARPKYMKPILVAFASLLLPALVPAADLKFHMQEIDATLKVGYGVVIADVNGDGKPDIVVADANRVVWYENPTWKRRTMIEGAVPPDIVCIAPCDIEGNGKVAFFIGADWRPFDTSKGGTIHWMRRGKTLDDPWEVFKIGEEPTVHRMRVLDIPGSGAVPSLVVAPLMGRDATKEKNWADGRPVRILEFFVPKDPIQGPWEPRVVDESLHVVHGFWARLDGMDTELHTASYEGITRKRFFGCGTGQEPIAIVRIHEGNQATPASNRGASEIKLGTLKEKGQFLGSVEPWHGHQVVAYRTETTPFQKTTWIRHVIDDKLRWGHALWCADLDGGGSDWIIAGVRDDLSKNPGERRGVRIYRCTDDKGEKWERQIIDDGGIACEDLTVADLNGDGRPDIIATGRQTGNVRIYWNEGRR